MKPKMYKPGQESSTRVAGGKHRTIRHGSSMKSPGKAASHKNLAPSRHGKLGFDKKKG